MIKNCIYRSKLNKIEQWYLLCTACELPPEGKTQGLLRDNMKLQRKNNPPISFLRELLLYYIANRFLHGNKDKWGINVCLKAIRTVPVCMFSAPQAQWPGCSLACCLGKRGTTSCPTLPPQHTSGCLLTHRGRACAPVQAHRPRGLALSPASGLLDWARFSSLHLKGRLQMCFWKADTVWGRIEMKTWRNQGRS